MNHIERFENKERLAEINIKETLLKAGLTNQSVVCDYGAGTGILSVEAASMTSGKVYALDMSQEMLDIIESKIETNSIRNIETIKVEGDEISLPKNSIDIFMMSTVFHHISDPVKFLEKVKTVLKPNGKILIIEFHKKDSPTGPPVSHRMSPKEVEKHLVEAGFNYELEESLGENLYFMTLNIC